MSQYENTKIEEIKDKKSNTGNFDKTELSNAIDHYLDIDIVQDYKDSMDNNDKFSDDWNEIRDDLYTYIFMVFQRSLEDYTLSNTDVHIDNYEVVVQTMDEPVINIPTIKDVNHIQDKFNDVLDNSIIDYHYYGKYRYSIRIEF